jgi:hypothetical protein
MRSRCLSVLAVLMLSWGGTAFAQQTGAISGRVTDASDLALPGVTIEARSNVLPTPRLTTTGGAGDYRLPALPPGTYTLTFEFAGMQAVTREARVQLAQETVVNTRLDIAGLAEEVTVTASSSLVDQTSASISGSVTNEEIAALPVGQQYRDLLKLIPAVQYTEDQVRGPSAGASGQDNVYRFDGVNVTLPLFGTLSAEPASHDIDQVTTTRGGARAIDFDRAGGFTIDSVSKSGTNRFSGLASFQLMDDSMTANREAGIASQFDQDRTWTTANIGGPILADRLFFYGSYYRPTRTRENQSNRYGALPAYESTRNEGFVKLTFTPINSVFLNVSYRDSKREDTSGEFASNVSPTTGTGNDSRQKIAIAEGSWIINSRSHATFKYTDYALRTSGRPDAEAGFTPSLAVGTRLDVNNLDRIGRFSVPSPLANQPAFNAFVQPLIQRYGYPGDDGQPVGGGIVGYGSQFDNNDFFRHGGQVGYNLVLGTTVIHELHVGYQFYNDAEELVRTSNGWGVVTVPGGRLAAVPGTGQSAFYTAEFLASTVGGTPMIRSEYDSHNIEVNDTIRLNNWTFNLGVLMSNDTLHGQGLREDSSVLSGYVSAPGNKYEMYKVPFSKMIQPRLGATWAYNGRDTVFASFAQYHPAASSLPRAASWDRNTFNRVVEAHFDAGGVLFATIPRGATSGKLFVEDLTPRRYDEVVFGTARQVNSQWTARLYGRYREGSHFWEDTNNNARVAFEPPAGIPRELYIPDLTARLAQIGSGSTYVITELDGAYTKYWEGTLETEVRVGRAFGRGSYTWSRYTGNFDQDNSTGANNDLNIFIGSSNIADGAGRQLWDFKEGRLRGDRPHLLKLYGYYTLGWNATAGGYLVAQSGHPWQGESTEPYRHLTTSTVSSNRYAEQAGSRRTPAHWQLDLNYTQDFRLTGPYRFQLAVDLFNTFDKQTGYNPQPAMTSPVFGEPRTYYEPRRFQVAARFLF